MKYYVSIMKFSLARRVVICNQVLFSIFWSSLRSGNNLTISQIIFVVQSVSTCGQELSNLSASESVGKNVA